MNQTSSHSRLKVYLDTAESMPQGVIFLDGEGNVLSVNRQFAQALGYEPATFQPKTIFQVNPHFNFMDWKKRWVELVATGHMALETEHLTAAGQTVPVRLHGILLELDGQQYCQATVLGDADESQEDLFLARFCLDNVREMITWVSPDGYVFYANKAVREVLGYTAEELSTMKVIALEPGFTEEDWRQEWRQVKQEGSLVREALRRTKSGDVIPVELSLHYMNYHGKEYKMAFVRDIRAKKAREEANLLSLKALNETSQVIYWMLHDGSLAFVNDATCEKFGYQRHELIGMKIYDIEPSITQKDWEARWAKLKAAKSLEIDVVRKSKSGEKIPVRVHQNYVAHEGKEYNLVFATDLRDEIKRETDLQAKLSEIERLKEQLALENTILKEEIQLDQGFGNIISRSPNYMPVLRQVGQVAATSATVLILGETGTGKELLAKAIHGLSDRAQQPMVKVNCAALPENLIESELFGHEKGAFTGAFQRKLGRFELAHQGTIFLDEIGEMNQDLQAKLLRVLQEGEFERLGGTETLKVDVRIIAATNRNLEEMVEKGRFREDLFYRLNVFPILNIPLRERKEDIRPLVRHFIEKYNQKLGRSIEEIAESVMKSLEEYEFPGNVRELENLIERAVILSTGKKLVADFQFKTNKSGKKNAFKSMEDLQRDHILEALKRTKGKVTGPGGAAELLDMNDKTLYSRMMKFNIGRLDYAA
ncbi:MAG: sigma 54-interacting transcriptional regulator [Saprospiraceae bacterium]|nr:sigma 54-interacting transcriptional regulator [Saprospiraceae bacterium]